MKTILLLLISLVSYAASAQRVVTGQVVERESGEVLTGATIISADSLQTVQTDNHGKFSIQTSANSIFVTNIGFEPVKVSVEGKSHVIIWISSLQKEMDAVVVSGTLKAVRRSESPVAVEVFTPQFLKKNPSPSIFESLQNVNGVRPQLNCSVCNTGDIHINGLEGPYTMITIDGMPIVSSLASVYGLFGIPTQLIDRIEIVKGPASGLYGAEAIGGLINIITKSPEKAPLFTANLMSTSSL